MKLIRLILLALSLFLVIACNAPDNIEEQEFERAVDKYEDMVKDEVKAAAEIGKAPRWVSDSDKIKWVWRYGSAEGKPEGEQWEHGAELTYNPLGIGSNLKINYNRPIIYEMPLFFDPTDQAKPYPDSFDVIWTTRSTENTGLNIYDSAGELTELHIGWDRSSGGFQVEGYELTEYLTLDAHWGKYNAQARQPVESIMAKYKTVPKTKDEAIKIHHRLSYRKGEPLLYKVSFNHDTVTVGPFRNQETVITIGGPDKPARDMDGTYPGAVLNGVSKIGFDFAGKTTLDNIGVTTDLKPIKPAEAK